MSLPKTLTIKEPLIGAPFILELALLTRPLEKSELVREIIRRWNAHEALVEACEKLRWSMLDIIGEGGGFYEERAAKADLKMLDEALESGEGVPK